MWIFHNLFCRFSIANTKHLKGSSREGVHKVVSEFSRTFPRACICLDLPAIQGAVFFCSESRRSRFSYFHSHWTWLDGRKYLKGFQLSLPYLFDGREGHQMVGIVYYITILVIFVMFAPQTKYKCGAICHYSTRQTILSCDVNECFQIAKCSTRLFQQFFT